MKYVRSTTQKAWKIAGHYIPPARLTESAKRAGVQPWLSLGESEYASLSKNKIYTSLLNNAEVTVSDTLPSEFVTLESVSNQNASLKNQLSDLKTQNTTLTSEKQTLSSKNRALKRKNEELSKEIDELKAQLAAASSPPQGEGAQ